MRPIYKISSAAAATPVSLTEAKMHLRLAATEAAALLYADENSYLTALIEAATALTEIITDRALITQTWDLYLQDWPVGDSIEIGKPPLQSVTHVKYTDYDGTETTWSSSEYIVDTDSEPGRIVLAYGYNWPDFTPYPKNPINVRFIAGYGAAGSAVPDPIIHAIKLLISHYYDNREHAIIGMNTSIQELPFGVMSLLSAYREVGF